MEDKLVEEQNPKENLELDKNEEGGNYNSSLIVNENQNISEVQPEDNSEKPIQNPLDVNQSNLNQNAPQENVQSAQISQFNVVQKPQDVNSSQNQNMNLPRKESQRNPWKCYSKIRARSGQNRFCGCP